MKKTGSPARPDSLRSVLGVGVLFVSVLLVFAGVKSHRDLAAARDRERSLQGTIRGTQERIDRLRGRIGSLRDDPEMLERLAREELGLARAGDVVIVLPPENASSPASAPAHPEPAAVR
ncbi:MAG TPA: septum formation initiator family protein [Thermoanaerobaculia bacterium]|nr:septum formation initiator family protein [Thermoanaerobaculia bacterium]